MADNMGGAAVVASALTKAYGGIVAVHALTLAVPAGCVFGLLGPNGAGKSTTIGCLTGLLDPTSGEVRILGERFTSQSVALKRRIGVMPEALGLFDYLYAEEFLTFQARIYGLDRPTTRRRVDELLEVLDLSAESGKPLGAFSAGMRKRVAFAAAIIHAPDVLFLDEPFESVDPAGVALMKQWLRDYVVGGGTVCLSTHMLDAAERLCDHAAIIVKGGRLVWTGDVAPLRDGIGLEIDGRTVTTLEALFLAKAGQRLADLAWLTARGDSA